MWRFVSQPRAGGYRHKRESLFVLLHCIRNPSTAYAYRNSFRYATLSKLQPTACDLGDRRMSTEKELALRAVQRDAQAFAALYDSYVNRIYHYIYFKVGSTVEAEDLTAQVFLKAWEAIGNYEWREHPFSAWLFRIARNLVVDYHRARREMVSLEEPDYRTPSWTEDVTAKPEIALQELFTIEQLRAAIRQLTGEQQEVIVLRFLEGYSTAEVATIMNKREGAIRGLQFRGLSALRDIFRSEDRHDVAR